MKNEDRAVYQIISLYNGSFNKKPNKFKKLITKLKRIFIRK